MRKRKALVLFQISTNRLAPCPMSSSTPNISVVVLGYRSAETISGFIDNLAGSLNEAESEWEIVLVGNYFENSGDRTPDVAKELAKKYPRVRPVTLVKEGMMGWDMKTGLRAATGKALAVIDGDGQMPYEDVVRCYKKYREEGADLVKTYRAERKDGLYRTCLSVGYNLVFKILFPGLNSRDVNSKPKLMKREVYEKMVLKSDGWFIDAEIMIQARRMKLNIVEVPTVFRDIETRSSFVKPRAILEFCANLIWRRILEFGYWFKK
ncbi:glycosyltransferase family 2 protein [Candidatus Uhrbacteria bacterium]|nr:glycosyltransferase family 2 protein [Candidatus Uhrbacteria bacterium]